MAALDSHEQEQIDALKHWWKTYGTQTLIAVVLAALAAVGVLGWKFWHSKQNAEASALYEQVLGQMSSNDPKRVDDAAAIVADKYGSTVYAARAQLLAAQMNMMANKPDAAVGELRWVTENSSDAGLKHAARLQLASLFLDQKKYDESLKLLDEAHPESFDSLYLNLKGDVYAAQGKKDAARTAYKAAIEKAQSKGNYVTAIELKLEALGGEASDGGAAKGAAGAAAGAAASGVAK
jgi:predicted negative regulator of RcsB-dependent stress response